MIRTTFQCRSCGANTAPLFSLGEQTVSDFTLQPEPGIRCPIDIDVCPDCTLVQARHSVDGLYRKYWYRSGVTDTMREHLRDVVEDATPYLRAGEVALDIGSNDGTLLRFYDPRVVTVGVEPAENLLIQGSDGISLLISGLWGGNRGAVEQVLELGGAKVVTACGMLYDLEDPNPFIADVAEVLTANGVFIAQLMCLKGTVELCDVGNFAHEHLEFYSLRSLQMLFARHGLTIFDVQENDVNGRSYRLFARKGFDGQEQPSVGRFLLDEECADLDKPAKLLECYEGMQRNRDMCVQYVRRVGRVGRVWVYGASTKGNVVLQWYGLTTDDVVAAADRSPEKHGLYCAGTGIPILPESAFREAQPDYALVLPYAFLPEFLARERAWRAKGGKFIVPIPELKVI